MTPTAISPAFSMDQHRTIQEWATPRPYGLRVEIETQVEAAEEVAIVTHRHAAGPLFYVAPLDAVRVEVIAMTYSAAGNAREERWEEPGIAEALAAVIEWERDLDENG